jgi:Mn-containing catalase
MIMRLDRLQAALPPPSDPDPVGASVVQELLGGKFGEQFLAGGAAAVVQDRWESPGAAITSTPPVT